MFTITKNNYSDAVKFIDEELSRLKLSDKEIRLAQLLLEENILRLRHGMGVDENFTVKIKIRRWFGDVSLILTVKGEEYNPIANIESELNSDDENYYNLAILKANRQKIGYARKNKSNVVSILVHEMQFNQIHKTLAAIMLGLCFGLLLKSFCPAEINLWLQTNIFHSGHEMFMNALSMMVSPMIFFSVMTGITNMDNSSGFGHIIGKFFAVSMSKVLIMAILGVIFSEIFFSDGLTEALSAIKAENNEIQPANFSLRDIIVGIIPNDVVEPFRSGNLLQVLFMACFFGVIINKSGERAHYVKDLIVFLNKFCLDVVNVVVKFMPPMIFFSMADMILHLGLDVVFSLGKVIFGTAMGAALTLIVSGILIGVFAKVSPVIFLKKILPFSILPFTLSSSNACLPLTMKFCSEKLGIDSKLAMFAIPIGIQFNMSGYSFYLAFMAVLMANTFGISVDSNLLLTVIISSVLIACSMTGVPGGVVIGLPPILAAIGVPLSAVSIVICIFSIVGMFTTVGNVAADISSTFLLAKSENKLDESIYRS